MTSSKMLSVFITHGNVFRVLLLLMLGIKSDQNPTPFESDVEQFVVDLRDYAKNTLGVDLLQKHFDKITSKDVSRMDGRQRLANIVSTFNAKTSKAKNVLYSLRTYFEDEHGVGSGNWAQRETRHCCGYNDNLRWNNLYQTNVNLNDFCEISPHFDHQLCPRSASAARVRLLHADSLLEKLKNAYQDSNLMARFLFYGREDGYYIQYPATNNLKSGAPPCACAQYDARFGPWYVPTVTPQDGRDVVIAVDYSTNMAPLKNVMKNVVKVLLDLLDGKDRVLLTLFRDNGLRYGTLPCMQMLTHATPAVISALKETIDGDDSFSGPLRYTTIFDASYDEFDSQTNRSSVIYLITSGRNSETRTTVVNTIKEKSSQANCTVTMNMFVVTQGSLTSDNLLAHQAYRDSICSCDHCSQRQKRRNQLILFDSTDVDIRSEVSKIYNKVLEHGETSDIHFTLPHINFNNIGTYMDACTRCMSSDTTIGVVCMSFISKELLGINGEQNEDAYVFLIDSSGMTFIHPKFAEPVVTDDRPFPLDIRTFETADGFKEIYDSMTAGLSGEKTLVVNASIPKGVGRAAFVEKNYTYYWQRISNSPFSVAVVVSDEQRYLHFNVTKSDTKERYHRLDVYNDSSTACMVENTVTGGKFDVVKLSPDVFAKPVSSYEDETLENIKELTTFLEMKTNNPPSQFANADVARTVREYVVATNVLEASVWRNNTSLGDIYAIWRYVGTEDGTLRLYPASQLNPYYDPRVRPWYVKGKAYPDSLILTTPYQDAFTGTNVITLAKAVFKNHARGRQVAGVMGIDFSLPYLQSIILKRMRECQTEVFASRCVIIDESGYLIFHKAFLNESIAETHLVDEEPGIAQSLIDSDLIQKDYCIGYFKKNVDGEAAKAHLKWFYVVKGVSQTISKKDSCNDYLVTPIRGTNMYLIKIKTSCNAHTCSCPEDSRNTCVKSTVTERKTCECPCYDYRTCLSELPPLESSLICDAPDKRTLINVVITKSWVTEETRRGLNDCFDPMCGRSETSLQCKRLRCEWCYEYPNGSFRGDDDRYCARDGTCLPRVTTTQVTSTRADTVTLSQGTSKSSPGLSDNEVIATAVVVVLVVVAVVAVAVWYFLFRGKKFCHGVPEDTKADPVYTDVIANPAAPACIQETPWL